MRGLLAMKGGWCWFAVESKTFNLCMEEVGEKLRGVIV